MSFSDENLKRFRDALSGDMPDTSIWSKADLEVLQALLSRLDAAERCAADLATYHDECISEDEREKVKAWQASKSAGKPQGERTS